MSERPDRASVEAYLPAKTRPSSAIQKNGMPLKSLYVTHRHTVFTLSTRGRTFDIFISCNSGGAWKIESATFSGWHLLLTTLPRLSCQSFKPQSMNIAL